MAVQLNPGGKEGSLATCIWSLEASESSKFSRWGWGPDTGLFQAGPFPYLLIPESHS